MSSKILSAAVVGLDCELIEVECDTGGTNPSFIIVGLPDTAVQESKERIRAAFKNSNLFFPRGRTTVNLAPADLKKEGPSYDLPIALSIILAERGNGVSSVEKDLSNSIFIGELSLNGSLRPVNGVLSVAIMLKKKNIKNLFLPIQNIGEASLIEGLNIYGVKNLAQLYDHLTGYKRIERYSSVQIENFDTDQMVSTLDMSHIKGQEQVKRAMEIAAAGAHNIFMSGPPGSGKTLLARTMISILPAMTLVEALEVTRIYSVAGLLPIDKPLVKQRPFRNPHHTASAVSIVGGGSWPKPGEISLAHRGVLFLDELPEFQRLVLETLRQPLEDGQISISRSSGTLQFPAKFIMLAAQNPCPCGYYGDPTNRCTCSASQIIRYQKKISGPLLDRMDIHIDVPKVQFDKLLSDIPTESSFSIRNRVQKARLKQQSRLADYHLVSNSEMSNQLIKKFCCFDAKGDEFLRHAISQLNLSARSYYRILKLSRTIADLADSEIINTDHIAEALQYRPKAVL